jgi:hypothetical protein
MVGPALPWIVTQQLGGSPASLFALFAELLKDSAPGRISRWPALLGMR